MKNYEIIAVFDSFYNIIVFLLFDEKISLEVLDSKEGSQIEIIKKIIDRLKTTSPKLRISGNIDGQFSTVAIEVGKDDTRYIDAVCDELIRAGIIAKVVRGSLKQTLKFVSEKMTLEQREKIIPELVNISDDTNPEAISEYEQILKDIVSLKKR